MKYMESIIKRMRYLYSRNGAVGLGPLDEPKSNYIPDEAIARSEEGRNSVGSIADEHPPVDEYSGEKIATDTPSHRDTKVGVVDDTVMPG